MKLKPVYGWCLTAALGMTPAIGQELDVDTRNDVRVQAGATISDDAELDAGIGQEDAVDAALEAAPYTNPDSPNTVQDALDAAPNASADVYQELEGRTGDVDARGRLRGDVRSNDPGASNSAIVNGRIDLRQADESVRSRYRNMNGEWWYQLKSGRWVYWRDNTWQDFDPSTYTPPEGSYGPRETPSAQMLQNAVPSQSYSYGSRQSYSSSPQSYNVVPRTYGDSYYDSGRSNYRNYDYGYNVSPYRSYNRGTPYYGNPYDRRRVGGPVYGYDGYGYGSGYRGFGNRGFNNFDRGARTGGAIGSAIGGAIGGREGSFIGGSVGAAIGADDD